MAMKIREEAFCTNGTGYDCELVLKRDKTLILREAETYHKEELEDRYDKHTLRPEIVFKGKSLRTGKFVEGDLAYVYRRDRRGRIVSVKPWIVSHHGNGGMLYIGIRHLVDPSTIEVFYKE